MKVLRLIGQFGCCLLACAILARADSIQLRDGRHLQGKYLGGSTTAIGFMTGGTVEYFPTADVLLLIFDHNGDSPLSGLQPSPMQGSSRAQPSSARVRQISVSSRDRDRAPRSHTASGSNSPVQSDAKAEE